MIESGCVGKLDTRVDGRWMKVPCSANGEMCEVAGESFSLRACLCEAHQKLAQGERLRVTPVGKAVEGVQGFD